MSAQLAEGHGQEGPGQEGHASPCGDDYQPFAALPLHYRWPRCGQAAYAAAN